MSRPRAVPIVPGPVMDAESRRWIEQLTAQADVRDTAITQLHRLMVKMARTEMARRSGRIDVRGPELDDIVEQAADDAVVSILRRLPDFRGESRFTTWACAFAIHEVAGKVGRHMWQRDGVRLEEDDWQQVPARLGWDPAAVAESRDLLEALQHAVDHQLTPLQRQVFTALVAHGTPVDVLAAELGSNRNAIYKTMSDARGKLRRHLATHGYLDAGVEDQ